MRILLAIAASMTVLCSMAQSHQPAPTTANTPSTTSPQPRPSSAWSPFWQGAWSPFWQPGFAASSLWQPALSWQQSKKSWQLIPYASLSAGTIFFNGATSYVSVPMGFALVRPLNNNLAAFGTISVAPTVFSMSRMNNGYSANPFSGNYGLDMHARIEGGLIYTNDARTFSVSGSVSVERGGYPINPALSHPDSRPKPAY